MRFDDKTPRGVLTRATIRRDPELFWATIHAVRKEVNLLDPAESANVTYGLKNSLEYTCKGDKREAAVAIGIMDLCTGHAFTCHYWGLKVGPDNQRREFYGDRSDNEHNLKNWYWVQNYDAIRAVFERMWGIERLATRPERLW